MPYVNVGRENSTGIAIDYNGHGSGEPVALVHGEPTLRASFQIAESSSPLASYACVDAWLTDFRAGLPNIAAQTLAVHGDADCILPFDAIAGRLRDEKLIADLIVLDFLGRR